MAAVLCLVMLPLFAAVGFMLGASSSIAAGLAFLVLAAFILFAAINMSRGWDEEHT